MVCATQPTHYSNEIIHEYFKKYFRTKAFIGQYKVDNKQTSSVLFRITPGRVPGSIKNYQVKPHSGPASIIQYWEESINLVKRLKSRGKASHQHRSSALAQCAA